jgi:exonuclease VII large subunit
LALSPQRVLSRGFISCETPLGKPVLLASSLGEGDSLRLMFPDGRVDSRVEKITENHKENPE